MENVHGECMRRETRYSPSKGSAIVRPFLLTFGAGTSFCLPFPLLGPASASSSLLLSLSSLLSSSASAALV